MINFGENLKQSRIRKGLSQNEFAKRLGTNHSLIGKYEREVVTPKIDVVVRMANILDTTVSFLLGESNGILKDPSMLKRIKEINDFDEKDKHCILYAIDAMIRDAKAQQAYK